jgi:dephospho-CoA kinase
MIVGLVGPICSGKESLAQYLVENFGFEAINILDLFRERIREIELNQAKREQAEECIE